MNHVRDRGILLYFNPFRQSVKFLSLRFSPTSGIFFHRVHDRHEIDTSFQLTSNEKVFLMDIHDEEVKQELEYDGVLDLGNGQDTEE
jgi:hypothetical protein